MPAIRSGGESLVFMDRQEGSVVTALDKWAGWQWGEQVVGCTFLQDAGTNPS